MVAATNRISCGWCGTGTFREDLYYRLSVIQVTLPPLRERRDEIPLLIDFFTDEAAEKLSAGRPVKMRAACGASCCEYDYPGNIRELRNLIFRISCLAGRHRGLRASARAAAAGRCKGARARRRMANEGQRDGRPSTGSLTELKRIASDEAEKEYLKQWLQQVGGKVAELARRIEHEPLAPADAAEKARHAVQGLPGDAEAAVIFCWQTRVGCTGRLG